MQWKKQSLGVLLLLIFACLGFVIGEFAPFTGAITIKDGGIWQIPQLLVKMGEPFSPVRNAAALDYAIIGAFIEAIIGVALSQQKKQKK